MPLVEQVLEKRQAILGPTHPDTLFTMHSLACNYTQTSRFLESMALHAKIRELRAATGDPDQYFLETYAVACQGAGKLDQAAALLHEALAQARKQDDSGGVGTASALGWLARNLLLQARYAEAEPFAREAIAIMERERPWHEARYYFVSILGAVLCGQRNYADAEPLLLQGYEGMKRREDILQANWKRRMAGVGEWVVRFYEVTNQPEKARAWREKTRSALTDPATAGVLK